jgi:hypothetical protein
MDTIQIISHFLLFGEVLPNLHHFLPSFPDLLPRYFAGIYAKQPHKYESRSPIHPSFPHFPKHNGKPLAFPITRETQLFLLITPWIMPKHLLYIVTGLSLQLDMGFF